jgi:DNA-binding IclR family transcriptional regulator
LTEIDAYLTQEELAQMVVASRERVSTALNSLRRGGLVRYSADGHLLLNLAALDRWRPANLDNLPTPSTTEETPLKHRDVS